MTSSSSDRRRRNLEQLFRFGLVGASGVVVNLVVLVVVDRMGPSPDLDVFPLIVGGFHVRWYHVYSTIAFVVANLWNFQLNRTWTFRSSRLAGWFTEYGPFLAVGLLGQLIGLLLLTLLMHQGSPVALPRDVLDGSAWWRNRLYWAQLVAIGLVTPFSFVLNKVWVFAAVRHHRLEALRAGRAR